MRRGLYTVMAGLLLMACVTSGVKTMTEDLYEGWWWFPINCLMTVYFIGEAVKKP